MSGSVRNFSLLWTILFSRFDRFLTLIFVFNIVYFTLKYFLGGCFLKGEQLVNQEEDYSDLNIPRSIGLTGSVDSLASLDSNQEMI